MFGIAPLLQFLQHPYIAIGFDESALPLSNLCRNLLLLLRKLDALCFEDERVTMGIEQPIDAHALLRSRMSQHHLPSLFLVLNSLSRQFGLLLAQYFRGAQRAAQFGAAFIARGNSQAENSLQSEAEGLHELSADGLASFAKVRGSDRLRDADGRFA
ncbi:hypothetical protein ETAA8_20530 [Anatilimnocola aggregata]|uniref:Uncharacterized protein n=1 Tax=Anatilimnocola aggregata TaxID=2528021 RepID=A0A517Y9R6_9BACT|nr:hypothetical protein ETAA8_20530 [Anatilimnocola aggregata]